MIENVIEWLRGEDTATLTLTQQKHINRVTLLAKKYPDECRVDAINPDGSILAHVPLSWIKISRPREVSEEQRAEAAERFARLRAGDSLE